MILGNRSVTHLRMGEHNNQRGSVVSGHSPCDLVLKGSCRSVILAKILGSDIAKAYTICIYLSYGIHCNMFLDMYFFLQRGISRR